MVKRSETAELFFLAAKIWRIRVRQNIYSSRHVSKGPAYRSVYVETTTP